MPICRLSAPARGRLTGAVLAALCWFGATAATAAAAQLVDRIVAVVNDDVILLSELEEATRPYLERLAEMRYPEDKARQMRFKVREDILSQLIDRKLTDQEVQRLGLKVTDAEIDQALERVKETHFLTDESLRDSIRRQGYTMEAYRENVRDQILRARLVSVQIKSRTVITDEDVRAYYESHPEEYSGERRVHLRVILLPHGEADLEQRKARVDAALAEGMPFVEAARRFGSSALAADGGNLGEFPVDRLAEPLQRAIAPLGEGEHTGWIDTDQGYQMLYVEKIQAEGDRGLEAVAGQIKEKLYKDLVDDKFREWIAELRERSYIRVVR